MTTAIFRIRQILRGLALATVISVLPDLALSDGTPTLNLWGMTGLIDMPSGESQPDGFLTFAHSRFGPISRNTLSFQMTPRLYGSFRYLEIRHFNDLFCPPTCTGGNAFQQYYDRNFDLRYQVLKENKYLPAVTVGLQDFVGTGISAAEYLVATKNLGHGVKVTAGLGFGRLGSYGPIAAPLGPRPKINIGLGGMFNFGEFFHGNTAPFGGIEWQINDKWGVKAEYSSDAYTIESQTQGTFPIKSPINFGIEYQLSDAIRLGAYRMYGTELGFSVNIALNLKERPSGGIGGTSPQPVKPRPTFAADPNLWSPSWVTQTDAPSILIGNITRDLAGTGIRVESLSFVADTARIRISNVKFDARAQAIGRVARALTRTLPASIETFEIIPVIYGLPASKVTLRRSDIEALEFAPDAAAALRARTVIAGIGAAYPNLTFNPNIYPKASWSIGPFTRTRLFDPANPFQIEAGLRLSASTEPVPGLLLSGSVTKDVLGHLGFARLANNSLLPHVRTDGDLYDVYGDPGIETLTAAYFSNFAPNLYGRITVGYLERMFGGVSTEVLWKRPSSRFGLGAELNYAVQRNPDGGFGFGYFHYAIPTGHLSAYSDLGKGYLAQLDVGQYLAGDRGGTLTLSREFSTGWRVSVFATLTNVSAKQFGEGSFDKGISIIIPISWLIGNPTTATRTVTIRPITRDGGARLIVDNRLYDLLTHDDQTGLDSQWSRFWK